MTRLNSIRELRDIPCQNLYDEACPIQDFGTIGLGNHFAEFQCLETVYDETVAMQLGLMKEQVFLLVV